MEGVGGRSGEEVGWVGSTAVAACSGVLSRVEQVFVLVELLHPGGGVLKHKSVLDVRIVNLQVGTYFSKWTKALCQCEGSQGNTFLSSSSSNSSSPTPDSNTLHLPRLKDCHSSLMAKKYKSSIVKNQSPICMKLYSRVVEEQSGGVRRTSCGCTVQVYFC